MDIKEILTHIPPSDLSYDEWLSVGMALKHEGFTAADWDEWSRNDSRYKGGECAAKWDGLDQADPPVTAGTIVQLAKERGLTFGRKFEAYGWNDEIAYEENIIPKSDEGMQIFETENFDPTEQIVRFLETVFKPDEYVGYVTEVYEHDGNLSPTRGAYDRTAGQLIEALKNCGGDVGAVLGDYDKRAGAWVRVNPLDGKGVKDENVTEYRYVLIESDSLPVERQNALIRELELPVVTLTYTGGKSLHALVRVGARDKDEYRKRVAYIFDVCRKNGLEIDKACKNPSRLSRFPGFERGGNKQFLIDTNLGKSSFEEWRDYIEEISDDLPDCESAADFWENMPDLAPPLIDGVLRQGHKMLIAGPSKAGKSFALIELCIALAEGREWFGFKCTRGKVLYVNLELDGASCKHRFRDVYSALGITPTSLENIDIWNLRGRSVPMDRLAPPLIRRAKKGGYIAVIIDPIYKVITGDENSADQMAHFCNQFDKVCNECGCAVIYCHHHSKGAQGGKKSMDRASGSGVFARDPDALLDMTELEATDALIKQQRDRAFCAVCMSWLRRFMGEGAIERFCPGDDRFSPEKMRETAHRLLPDNSYKLMMQEIEAANKTIAARSAWRIEGTLREFRRFPPLNLWFDYPVHRPDPDGVLQDCDPEEAYNPRKNLGRKKTKEELKSERITAIEVAFEGCEEDGMTTVKQLARAIGKSVDTVYNYLDEHGGFWRDKKGNVGRKA